MGEAGNISSKMPSETQSLASLSDWYDVRELDISEESGDVVIATKYPGMVLKGVKNLSKTAEADVIFKTKNNASGDAIPFPLDIREFSGKLPEIHTLVKTGTSDNLLLYFQKL